jgi:hypothetical protein
VPAALAHLKSFFISPSCAMDFQLIVFQKGGGGGAGGEGVGG